jgi:putative ABC transport system permease protein
VARQYLTESVILALAGGVVGLVLGSVGRSIFLASIPEAFPYYLRFDINITVILCITGVAVLSGVLFGLVPVAETSRINLFDVLRYGGATVSDGLRRKWIRSLLIVTEVAMALVVLIGAGLMVKSLVRLQGIEPGFDTENLLTMEVELPRETAGQTDRAFAFFEDVRERIAALPDVVSASAVSNLPMGRSQWQGTVSVEGLGPLPAGEEPWAIGRSIQRDYFRTMGIPLVSGRAFDERDLSEGSPEVVIVNQSFAEKYWPDGGCLGGRIKYGEPDSEWPWMEIVGIAGGVRHYGLDSPVELGYYKPFSQTTFGKMTLVVRTRSDPMEVTESVRAGVWEIDPNASVWDIRTMDRVIYEEHWEPVVYSRTFNTFSALALILAALGVYGVVAFSVVQRTREFGIRMALGARSSDVVKLAVRRIAILTGFGLLSGLIVALALMRLLSSLLFGVTSYDPGIYTLMVVAMGAVAIVAGYIPARRAARANPVSALRHD